MGLSASTACHHGGSVLCPSWASTKLSGMAVGMLQGAHLRPWTALVVSACAVVVVLLTFETEQEAVAVAWKKNYQVTVGGYKIDVGVDTNRINLKDAKRRQKQVIDHMHRHIAESAARLRHASNR